MKVLQINTVINTGSTGKIAEQIGERVLKNKGTSYIAGSRVGNSSSSEIIKIGNMLDVYWHVLITRLLDKHGLASKRATQSLIKLIKNIDPDVIHLHNIHGYYLHVGELFQFLEVIGKPVVWTFHDCWPFTGHCSYFDRFACEKWKTECEKCPMQRYYPSSWFIDNSKNNFRMKRDLFTKVENLTIVTPSTWLQRMVKQSFFQKTDTIEVIHNGVDLDVFKPSDIAASTKEKYGLKDTTILLGVASIWDKRKGFDDFIALSGMLKENYKIVLVGLSKDQVNHLPENIIGLERTENSEELAALYTIANVFINPTYSDNFPTTNIEALACGTPVITYATGGSPEAIDAHTGITLARGDIEGMLIAVNEIVHHPSAFSAKHCRARAEKYFNKDDRFDDYVALYRKVIERNA